MDNYEAYLEFEAEPYMGEWVGFIDGKFVAHSKDFGKIYDDLNKKFPKKIPFITLVPTGTPRI